MSLRSALLAAAGTLAAVALIGAPVFSTAAFTARTTNPTSTVAAAADWTPPTVSMVNPGSPLTGTVSLTATAADGESGIARVVIQQQVTNAATWTPVCTATVAPYTCSWNTTAVADGSYDLRAVATDGAGLSTTSVTVRTIVANTALVVLTSPPDVVRGTVALSTTIVNGGASNYVVRVEYAPAGTTNWTAICTGLVSPYACSWATTSFANGNYDLRAVATSGGSTFTSAVVIDTLVDNLAPVVTMTDPGSPLSGFVTLAATATDAHSGVARVVIESAPTGSSTWTARCTLTAAPYSCRFDTATLVNGSYSFRAVVDDVAGNRTISATVANRVIDNVLLRGHDVQAVNVGGAIGSIDTGDVVTLTYTDAVALGTITSGWTGAALPVSVRFRDGKVLGLGDSDDTFDVLRDNATVNLGSVALRNDVVKSNRAALFAATMRASSATINGRTVTVITLTLGSTTDGNNLSRGTAASMIWTPSDVVTDAFTNRSSTAPTTELGTLDRDF